MRNSIDDATPNEWDSLNKLAKEFNCLSIRGQVKEVIPKALDKQIGGEHYRKFAIQPAEFCYKNNIPYLEATAIKYLCRWKDKGGIQDLDKAIHFIQLLKEFQND
ncbi:SaV-like [uncultured Caudovirales phage]|uniref:SaV-like n=1 Tax=uncultured Caudovirales phage TaxID=2100421 RepID=A0A6J5T864_9CAUD|nr:SaV-like [uncultured Caudovirales phage]